MSGHHPWTAVRDDLRARANRDPRVAVVARAFLAQRLGLVGDDLELLADATVRDLLALPAGVLLDLAAARLLERLDAQLARAHPVDLDHVEPVHDVPHAAATIARVPLDDDVSFDLTLRRDGMIDLDRDLDPLLTPDDAEALAYALLRLVALAREEETP